MNAKLAALIASGSLLAAGAGYLTSEVLAQSTPEPSRTVTVDIDGEPGPSGPPGPPGPPGASGDFECRPGFSYTQVEFVKPGEGPVIGQFCVQD